MTWLQSTFKLEGVPQDVVTQSLRSVLDIVRCAICLDTVRPEIVQCIKGHLLCGECRQDLEICPTCRQPFNGAKTHPLLFQLLDALPQQCRYDDCRIYVEDGDCHEVWCGFQPTQCRISDCDWVGPSHQIYSHIHKDHPNEIILNESNPKMKLRYSGRISPQIEECFYPIMAFGQFFWMETNSNDTASTISFHIVPNGKPHEDYFFELQFKSTNHSLQSKVKFHLECQEMNFVYLPNACLRYHFSINGFICNLYVTRS
ncbi:hypothetical protein J6590_066679 [Homalodisca vitripennis]|nr:hypothetical protein J6590_066679 [Homalodisca vitripennis]